MPTGVIDQGDGQTPAELCTQLGELLEYGRPLPDAAAAAMITHPEYARYVMAARGNLPVLEHLIASAPAAGRSSVRLAPTSADRPAPEAAAETDDGPSSAALVAGAARSVLRWAATSFTPVDDAVYERRLHACAQCPHYREPPKRIAYRIAKAIEPDAKICGLCGCVASKKARLPHESCPAIDPANPPMTRWGEPRVPTGA